MDWGFKLGDEWVLICLEESGGLKLLCTFRFSHFMCWWSFLGFGKLDVACIGTNSFLIVCNGLSCFWRFKVFVACAPVKNTNWGGIVFFCFFLMPKNFIVENEAIALLSGL